jgi:hypothetical protein
MKKLITMLAAAVSIITITTHTQSDVPKPPLERTGAPGESYCTDCHTGTPLNEGGGSMSIVFSGKKNHYVPGGTYTIEVAVTDPAQSIRGGFETTILDDLTNSVGTNIITNPANTLLRYDSDNGRYYVSNYAGVGYSYWSFKWTAPSTNAGDITIYCATNSSNDDFTPLGDHIYASTLTLHPLEITHQKQEANGDEGEDEFSVTPNLIEESFSVRYVINDNEHVQISLYNLQGQLQENFFDGSLEPGMYEPRFTFSKKYEAGVYLLMLRIND